MTSAALAHGLLSLANGLRNPPSLATAVAEWAVILKAEVAEKLPNTYAEAEELEVGRNQLVAKHHARLTGPIEEDSWLVFPVLNMMGKWLKSMPDKRLARDEYVK